MALNRRKFLHIVLILIIAIVATFLVTASLHRADLADYASITGLPDSSPSKFKVTFAGVSTLLFNDGETAFMTDGFFSRPGLLKLIAGELTPDESAIFKSLEKMQVKTLAAVIPIHSHHDHALDSSVIAKKTNARMIGSASTANIGRSFGLPENQIQIVGDKETIKLG